MIVNNIVIYCCNHLVVFVMNLYEMKAVRSRNQEYGKKWRIVATQESVAKASCSI